MYVGREFKVGTFCFCLRVYIYVEIWTPHQQFLNLFMENIEMPKEKKEKEKERKELTYWCGGCEAHSNMLSQSMNEW